MKNEFYVVLPSDSSEYYFPGNTVTNYLARLPREIRLNGEWVVGMTEIQFPQTFSHIPDRDNEGVIVRFDEGIHKTISRQEYNVLSGAYKDIEALIREINEKLNNHFYFELDLAGHTVIKRNCTEAWCSNVQHDLYFSKTLSLILGFHEKNVRQIHSDGKKSKFPACLTSALPSVMHVYTDICESLVVGNSEKPLLRAVPTDIDNYVYGSIRTRIFSSPNYIPVTKSNFNTIRVDIKGFKEDPMPFEYGKVTVTLHFKRTDC